MKKIFSCVLAAMFTFNLIGVSANACLLNDEDNFVDFEYIFCSAYEEISELQPRRPGCYDCGSLDSSLKSGVIVNTTRGKHCSKYNGAGHFSWYAGEHYICNSCGAYIGSINVIDRGYLCSTDPLNFYPDHGPEM